MLAHLLLLVAPAQVTDPVLAAMMRAERRVEVAQDETNALEDSPAAARVGQSLFYNNSLSSNGKVSCATCHEPSLGFTTREPLARGVGLTERNAPTLLDATRRRWFGWGGRNDSLWSQAIVPLLAPHEMGSSAEQLRRALQAQPELGRAWTKVYGENAVSDDVLLAQAGKSLAAYQRRLVTGRSAFDDYARALRDKDAAAQAQYPPLAAQGALLFFGKAGCRSCHAGPEFTDEEFHDLGLPPVRGRKPDEGRREGLRLLAADRFRADSPFSDAPRGARAQELAFLVATDEDWGRFKTPSLRNVTRTAPYMHTGQFSTLQEVLRFYSTLEGAAPRGHHGETVLKPLHLTADELTALEAFLRTLEGSLPAEDLLRPPVW